LKNIFKVSIDIRKEEVINMPIGVAILIFIGMCLYSKFIYPQKANRDYQKSQERKKELGLIDDDD
jgi:hypothetical protein